MTMISINFIFNLTNFCVVVSFFDYITNILFSKAGRSIVVDKLVILGILFLTLFILALRAEVVARLVILGISILVFNLIYFCIKGSISS